jgi:hypothetical protein
VVGFRCQTPTHAGLREVIRIDEALATIDLLERCDSDLYRKVRELVDSVMPVKIHHAKVVTPPAPVFHFPGRLAA